MSATAAAIVVVAMGLFECVVVAPAAVAVLLQPALERGPSTGTEPDVLGPPMTWVVEHSIQMLVFHGVLGVVALAGGLGAWLRQRWARRASQLAMSVLVLSWLASGALMAISLNAPQGSGVLGAAFFALFRLGMLGVSAFWGAVTGVPIWLLERPDARLWFEEAGRR